MTDVSLKSSPFLPLIITEIKNSGGNNKRKFHTLELRTFSMSFILKTM